MQTTSKIYFAITALFLSACSSMEIEPESVAMPQEVKEFVFLKQTPSNADITNERIFSIISQEIMNGSHVNEVRSFRTDVAGLNEIRGLEVSRDGSVFEASYVNGDHHVSNNVVNKTVVRASFEVEIEDAADVKRVRVVTPGSVTLGPGRSAIFLPIKPLLTVDQAVQDVTRINDRLSPEFEAAKEYSGEFDVQYRDEAVYANYSRALGEYERTGNRVTKYDIEKDRLFELGEGDVTFPVKITVYPYRDGSKVLYDFNVPYLIKGDGTHTLDEEDVKRYIDRIEAIANS